MPPTIRVFVTSLVAMLGLGLTQSAATAQSLSKADEAFVDACVQRLVKENGLMLAPQIQNAHGMCMTELEKRKPRRSVPQPSAAQNSSPIRVGVELECMLVRISLHRNGALVSESKVPSNTKPVFYKFDGQRLSAYYKVPNAPQVSSDGALFIGRNTVVNEGRTFQVSYFAKSTAMSEKIEFFYESNTQEIKPILLVSRFSENGFVSHGEYLYRCKE